MFIWVYFYIILNTVFGQKKSPCQGIFEYENKNLEEGKWTGAAHLLSDEDLQGVSLRIILDSPANLLINWFGQSTSKDNKEFIIMNAAYKLKEGLPLIILFEVSYNVVDLPPSLIELKLNGQTICRGNHSQSSSTERNFTSSSYTPTTSHFTTQITTTTEDILHFIGDLNIISKGKHLQPPILLTETIQCGQVVEGVTPLITYGAPSKEGAWPWHVAIYASNGDNLSYICGGSLLDESHVITAAHCVTKHRTTTLNDPNIFSIHLGRTNLKEINQGYQERRIATVFVHPDFNSTTYNNDLAILKLSRDATYTDYVRPVCLWSKGKMASVEGRLGTVVGWGFDINNQIQNQLHETKMPVVNTVTCIFSQRNVFNIFTSETTLCAGYRNGSSVCNGDSGGGMFFPQNENANIKTWEIRALVSISLPLQGKACDPFNYVIFTDLAHHINWIKEKLKEN